MENYRSLNNGVGRILNKRLNQLAKVATIEQDVKNNSNGQLANMAHFLCLNPEESTEFTDAMNVTVVGRLHSWHPVVIDKMLRESYEERLAMAGALIAAELDRLEYLRKNNTEGRV